MDLSKQKIAPPPTCAHDWSLLQELELDPAAVSQRSAVFRRSLHRDGQTIPVFVKIYSYTKHPLERLWRAGRSCTEARNLDFFRQIGIVAPQVIDWGERRNRMGKLSCEFIITAAITGTQQLDEFVVKQCPHARSQAHINIRNQIIDTLADWTARIHRHHFFHADLKWRNILARLHNGMLELAWIDCPKGRFKRRLGNHLHARLKDCATLDKIARYYCTPAERRRFVARYLGCAPGDSRVARFAEQVDHYRRRRFDPDDGPPRLRCNP